MRSSVRVRDWFLVLSFFTGRTLGYPAGRYQAKLSSRLDLRFHRRRGVMRPQKFRCIAPCFAQGRTSYILRLSWPHYGIGQVIIFSSYGFFLLSIFLLSFLKFFFSPILSRRRLDVCHTSTHGVALVRIQNAGLKCAARGSLKIQTQILPKIRHLRTIAQLCPVISSQLRHVLTTGKKLVKQQYLLSSQHDELRPISGSLVWSTQQISTGFGSWLRYCCDVAQRKPTKLCTMFGRLLGLYTIYTFLGGSCLVTEFCQVQNSLCVQVLRSPILAALLHDTRVVSGSQTLRR